MLDLLPVEIIVLAFSHLGYRDLLTCSFVCRLFHTVVQENASCQYTIDLAVSGMKDGPPSVLGHADRLSLLRKSQAAWHTLQWTALKDDRMLQGSLYELCGGVLAQSNQLGGRGLTFRQLPSHYRSIEERVWSLDLDFIIRDFTLDPAQDLLVLIARPILHIHAAQIETSIHLRSLTTGKVHPLATRSPVLVHDVDVHAANLTFMLQVHGDRVGVHFISHGTAPSELVVWDWKTGETLLNTYGANLMAFGFLTERLILTGGFVDEPRLFVVDLESGEGERMEFEQVEYLCAFLYPTCHPSVHALNFSIRSDPCIDWTPHPSVRVPFSVGPGPRLYVVTIWVLHGDGIVMPIDLFVLSSTLLEHVDSVGRGETRHNFEWLEWGPRGTRMMVQAPHSDTWVCYVFGTRFSAIVGGRRRTLELWDFNQLGIKKDLGRGREGEVEWHVGDTNVLNSRVFVEEVRTGLPYRVSRRKLRDSEPVFTDVMCSEDNVILVDTHNRHFRILTF